MEKDCDDACDCCEAIWGGCITVKLPDESGLAPRRELAVIGCCAAPDTVCGTAPEKDARWEWRLDVDMEAAVTVAEAIQLPMSEYAGTI